MQKNKVNNEIYSSQNYHRLGNLRIWMMIGLIGDNSLFMLSLLYISDTSLIQLTITCSITISGLSFFFPFCGGRGFEPEPFIYYTLSLSTELNSRENLCP